MTEAALPRTHVVTHSPRGNLSPSSGVCGYCMHEVHSQASKTMYKIKISEPLKCILYLRRLPFIYLPSQSPLTLRDTKDPDSAVLQIPTTTSSRQGSSVVYLC